MRVHGLAVLVMFFEILRRYGHEDGMSYTNLAVFMQFMVLRRVAAMRDQTNDPGNWVTNATIYTVWQRRTRARHRRDADPSQTAVQRDQ